MQSTKGQRCASAFHAAAAPIESDEPLLLASATAVSGNVDLVAEILRCLPIKSLVRAKTVSKQWLSLIESPFFSRLRNPNSNLPSGLFVGKYSQQGQLCYVPFDTNHYHKFDVTAHEALAFFNDERPNLFIRQACNGFLLCSRYEWTRGQIFYVVNPKTKQLREIPLFSPGWHCLGATLAFDPSKSPYYKLVVFLYDSGYKSGYKIDDSGYKIAIYSSKTSKWRKVKVSHFPWSEFIGLPSRNGVFWNGAINWLSRRGNSAVYLKVEEESLHTMPMPPIPPGMGSPTVRYFGEYRGHLYLVLFLLHDGHGNKEFTIYEMKRDYSSWFVKYSVHFNEFVAAFPDMEYCLFRNSKLGMVVGMEKAADDDDCEWLLFARHKPKVVSYNFKHKKFEEISHFSYIMSSSSGTIVVVTRGSEYYSTRWPGWPEFYPYIERLSHV